MSKYSFPPFKRDVIEAIESHKKAIIVGHISPDGDCFNSQLSMQFLLNYLGYEKVILANAGPFERSEALAIKDKFTTVITDEMLQDDPLFVMVDCGELSRIGSLADALKDKSFLVLDHHPTSLNFHLGPSYILPTSVSSTLIVEKLFEHFQVPINEEMANRLFFGFATDTGFFNYIPKGNGEAIRMAATLVENGADPRIAFAKMNGGKSRDFIKNTALLINRTEYIVNGHVALSYFKKDDGTECPSDSYYSQMFKCDDTKGIVLLKETKDGKIILGLRASYDCEFDMSAFAQYFGGGGHKKASGAALTVSLDKAMEMVKKRLEETFICQ